MELALVRVAPTVEVVSVAIFDDLESACKKYTADLTRRYAVEYGSTFVQAPELDKYHLRGDGVDIVLERTTERVDPGWITNTRTLIPATVCAYKVALVAASPVATLKAEIGALKAELAATSRKSADKDREIVSLREDAQYAVREHKAPAMAAPVLSFLEELGRFDRSSLRPAQLDTKEGC